MKGDGGLPRRDLKCRERCTSGIWWTGPRITIKDLFDLGDMASVPTRKAWRRWSIRRGRNGSRSK